MAERIIESLSFVSLFDMYLRTICSFLSNLPYAGWNSLDYRAHQVVIPPPPREKHLLFVNWLLPPLHPSLRHYCFPSPSRLSREQESSVPGGAAACGSSAYTTPFVHQQGGAHGAGCATPALFSLTLGNHVVFSNGRHKWLVTTCSWQQPWLSRQRKHVNSQSPGVFLARIGEHEFTEAEWVLQTARKTNNKQVSHNQRG